ncbi:hypothetical protein PQX77_005255 [Marasmius sp. AFHP31]|nr:hypothetical protein PQX77_005255 [Marasmius sp. AFHP31]
MFEVNGDCVLQAVEGERRRASLCDVRAGCGGEVGYGLMTPFSNKNPATTATVTEVVDEGAVANGGTNRTGEEGETNDVASPAEMKSSQGEMQQQLVEATRIGEPAYPIHSLVELILQSDYVPSGADYALFKKRIEDDRAFVKGCKEKLAMLRKDSSGNVRSRMNQLEAEKSSAETRVHQYRVVLSARRRIPTEIWEQIFGLIWCLPDEYSLRVSINGQDYGKGRHGQPTVTTLLKCDAPLLVISHVCVRWRHIAIGRPSLWDSLSFHISRFRIPRTIQRLVKLYLARSQGRISRLRLMTNGAEVNAIGQKSCRLWKYLSNHLSHCKDLHLSSHDFQFSIITDSFSFPLLESYRFVSTERQLLHHIPHSKALNCAPRLTRISVGIFDPSLKYSRLTFLEIGHMDTRELLRTLLLVLTDCGRLETLLINDLESGPRVEYEAHPVIPRSCNMPFLRMLSISDSEDGSLVSGKDSNLSSFLFSLILPSLSSLSLRCRDWLDSLLPMLQRCSAPVERLTLWIKELRNPNSDDNTLFTLLRSLRTTLTCVDLTFRRITAASMSAQHILSFIMNPMLSKLKSVRLRLLQFTIDAASVENVLRLISQRNRSVTVADGSLRFEGSKGNQICQITDFCLVRIRWQDPSRVVSVQDDLSSELNERIREMERQYGVSIRIGKL